jgi:hypothetical protein
VIDLIAERRFGVVALDRDVRGSCLNRRTENVRVHSVVVSQEYSQHFSILTDRI